MRFGFDFLSHPSDPPSRLSPPPAARPESRSKDRAIPERRLCSTPLCY